ncbi:MAG: prolipoprotein diacylglyceryl transferase [Bacteroidia bacterium]|nr:prolipoprotein diacylglyceryl transferase [Bacteroidia bacterium]
MYPNFYFLFKDLFGVELHGLVFVNTFGFFVALSFLLANYTMGLELKRKEGQGLIEGMPGKKWFGKLPSSTDYIGNAVLGFVFGWKFLYLFTNGKDLFDDPQSHILSMEGSLVLGVLAALVAVGLKYYESIQTKKKYPEPELRDITIRPHQRMGTMTLYAAVAGLLGAKIFDHMEHWDEFIQNPLGAFLDPFSGLTFYGGLICGGAAVLWYARKVNISWKHMLDVGGPAMMLAYGVGRIGCHMSGDGDWGIVNNRPNPGWLPDWLWAYTYPNNVAGICNPVEHTGCAEGTIPELIFPVWPTPIYETIMCLSLFAALWYLRKRISVPGVLFGIYLFMAGFERFWIEKIRVNATYNLFGMEITQAEIISVVLMLLGVGMIIWFKKTHKPKEVVDKSTT